MLRTERQKLRSDALGADVEQSMAAKQVATEMIDDGQGVAVDAVAHQELALEVDRPDLVRCCGVEGRRPRMLPVSASAPRLGAAVALQDVEDRAARRPGPFWEPRAQALEDLSCAPAVSLVLFQHEFDQLARRLVWTRSRR